MDSVTIAIIIVVFALLILLIILKVVGVLPERGELKGKIGEKRVNNRLSDLLQEDEYILTNLLVPMKNNHKTEVDTVLITRKGIFSVETKNWSGYISGDEYSEKWIQTSYYYGSKKQRPRYNPVKQNETHVHAIERVLQFKYDVFNVVVMVGYDKLHVNSSHVFGRYDFGQHYRCLSDVLTETDILNIYAKLQTFVATDEELKQHKEEIKRMHPDND